MSAFLEMPFLVLLFGFLIPIGAIPVAQVIAYLMPLPRHIADQARIGPATFTKPHG